MKHLLSAVLFLFAFSVLSAAEKATPSTPTWVACVGDSITAGFGLGNPQQQAYPAQLEVLLGEGWDVRNFGVSSMTMVRKNERSYWNTPAFKSAQAFQPPSRDYYAGNQRFQREEPADAENRLCH